MIYARVPFIAKRRQNCPVIDGFDGDIFFKHLLTEVCHIINTKFAAHFAVFNILMMGLMLGS